MFKKIKKIIISIPGVLRVYFLFKNFYFSISNFIPRKIRKIRRIFISENHDRSYGFVILCIKKKVYFKMAIKNINSLHYINPTHHFHIYCDNKAFKYFKRNRYKFDYPNKVFLENKYGSENFSWQHCKIENLISASSNNYIMIDADSVWHSDPIIDQDKVTMLVVARKFTDDPDEVLLLENIIEGDYWRKFNHSVAAFVSLPKKFLTQQIIDDLRYFNNLIFNNDFEFLTDKSKAANFRRLSEEFAVNLALQKNIETKYLISLKSSDPFKDKNLLESIFYGCLNNVLE